MLWLALLWGVGFMLKPPLIEPQPVAIDARLVELTEAQAERKPVQLAAVKPRPPVAAQPKQRAPQLVPPQPREPQPDPVPPVSPEPIAQPAQP
jgi:hypothetical protein